MDSSNYADEILDEIAMRSWSKDTEFHLLSVIEPCPNWEAEQECLHKGRLILDQLLEWLKRRLPKHEAAGQVLEGRATRVITKTAEELGAHLIVIGSHGDTGTRKAGIGSAAAAAVNDAPCSVEVVKLRQGSGERRLASVWD